MEHVNVKKKIGQLENLKRSFLGGTRQQRYVDRYCDLNFFLFKIILLFG